MGPSQNVKLGRQHVLQLKLGLEDVSAAVCLRMSANCSRGPPRFGLFTPSSVGVSGAVYEAVKEGAVGFQIAMMRRLVDNVLGVAKESTKRFCQESFNQAVKLINGFSAFGPCFDSGPVQFGEHSRMRAPSKAECPSRTELDGKVSAVTFQYPWPSV